MQPICMVGPASGFPAASSELLMQVEGHPAKAHSARYPAKCCNSTARYRSTASTTCDHPLSPHPELALGEEVREFVVAEPRCIADPWRSRALAADVLVGVPNVLAGRAAAPATGDRVRPVDLWRRR